MRRITWIAVSLTLALTASLVVAKTWSERLNQARLADATAAGVEPASAHGLPPAEWSPASSSAVNAPEWGQSEPALPAARLASMPAAQATASPSGQRHQRSAWTVKVVRGQQVEEVHYRSPYGKGSAH